MNLLAAANYDPAGAVSKVTTGAITGAKGEIE